MELATTRPKRLYSEWPVLVGELINDESLHRVGAWKSEKVVPLDTGCFLEIVCWEDCWECILGFVSKDIQEPSEDEEIVEMVDIWGL